MLFDSHAHYNDTRFDADRFRILDSMKENGIGYIVNAADSMESIDKILPLCEKYDFVYAGVGVHPEEVGNLADKDIDRLREISKHKKVCAIGEIGLDYHYDDVPREVQKYWFDRQLTLAEEVNLPVIIHDREAHMDCLDILKRHDIKRIGGVMHCYSGSSEMAEDILSLGVYFGFGGTVTFKNAKKVQKAAEKIPIIPAFNATTWKKFIPRTRRRIWSFWRHRFIIGTSAGNFARLLTDFLPSPNAIRITPTRKKNPCF